MIHMSLVTFIERDSFRSVSAPSVDLSAFWEEVGKDTD